MSQHTRVAIASAVMFCAWVSASGPALDAIERKATVLAQSANKAAQANLRNEAEKRYKAAIAQCDLLPPEKFRCRTDVLWGLARFYSQVQERSEAEGVYRERLDVLLLHQKMTSRPDLDVGIALFELQSFYSDPNGSSRDAEESRYMDDARRFYRRCINGFPDLKPVCDRSLADVEGLHGTLLFLKKRYDDAAPFLKAVTDRPDDGVRRETLVASLNAYARILAGHGRTSEAEALRQRAERLEARAQ